MAMHEIEAWTGREASLGPALDGWERTGTALTRELAFRDFDAALSFVERVAREAVDYQRRPDLCISEFNRVRVTIANLNHAGLTAAELRLAEKVDAVIDGRAAGPR